MSRRNTKTGGREATTGVIPGRYGLSVGNPNTRLPDGWRWTRLLDVARLETGHTPSRRKPEYWGGDIPWIGIKDARVHHGRDIHTTNESTNQLGIDNSAARVLPINTVCLSRTASIGYITRTKQLMCTSQDFVNWVCDEQGLSSRYLMYVLLSEVDSLYRFAHGTSHQTIYFPEVKAFHVALPPLPEQRRIAAVLGALDDKIELNRKMNQTLEEIAQALFKSWFIDFDGHDLVDSELGPIPRGWGVGTLADVTSKIGSGATPRGGSKAYIDEGVAFIRSQNIYDFRFSWPGLVRITDDAATKLRGVTVERDDVLFNITGDSILRTCVVDPAVLPARVNQHVAILRAASVPPRFLHLWMVRPKMKSYLLGFSAGATRKAVTKGHLQSVPIIMPPDSRLRQFEEATRGLFERKETNRAQSRTLADLRDTLLPKLISGEIRVPEAKAAGAEAM